MAEDRADAPAETRLRALRRRADDDCAAPAVDRPPGRHQLDLPELGLRVSITRARYPNRADGVDQYAVTVSRPVLDAPPAEREVRLVLAMTFGDTAAAAVERGPSARPVRMFRVPAAG